MILFSNAKVTLYLYLYYLLAYVKSYGQFRCYLFALKVAVDICLLQHCFNTVEKLNNVIVTF